MCPGKAGEAMGNDPIRRGSEAISAGCHGYNRCRSPVSVTFPFLDANKRMVVCSCSYAGHNP